MRSTLAFLCVWTAVSQAAPPACPAGQPLGPVQLTVTRAAGAPAIPLNTINRLHEGDRIQYSPVLRSAEKRSGKVTVVLIAAAPQDRKFVVLEPADAAKPASWTVPFRSSLGVYVYGPSGLSTRKLTGLLNKDQELASQLADYAERTAQTEAVLDALADFQTATPAASENLGAALEGFARQNGITDKIDRKAPLNEQTLTALRTLNPALSAYDPIAPSAAQRMSQTAGLAATVAGMFLGSTVGLAAGSTAMALNLKTLIFPDSDFRSAYGQRAKTDGVALCTSRAPQPSRKRIAYLWALRIPDADKPSLTIAPPLHAPSGLRSAFRVTATEEHWKLASRVREWALDSELGGRKPVKVTPVADRQQIEVDLAGVEPGRYKLDARWDWDWFSSGELVVDSLSNFDKVQLTPESQNRLRPRSGKQLLHLTGADFQFLEKAALLRKGDRYSTPAPVPFTLPAGPRTGPQDTVEMQVDTAPLEPGAYQLLLAQADGKPRAVDIDVLADPPKITTLPIVLNEGDAERVLELQGEGLHRITALTAEGLEVQLDGPGTPNRRTIRVRQATPLKAGSTLDVSMAVEQYPQPVALRSAIRVAGPRPRIRKVQPSLPAGQSVALRPGELPAGAQVGALVEVEEAGPQPAAKLGCREGREAVAPDKFSRMGEGTFFLSFDPGRWPAGCVATLRLENGASGSSDAVELGRVVHLPRIDEFRLTGEAAADGAWTGVLTGRNLELIGKTGWDAATGLEVPALPAAAEGGKQTLQIQMTWPSPAPRAPLYIWLRGETEGRATTARY